MTVVLADATGVDAASIALTVGTLGTFTVEDAAVIFFENTLVFDAGGDDALGEYGASVTATLDLADTILDGQPDRPGGRPVAKF